MDAWSLMSTRTLDPHSLASVRAGLTLNPERLLQTEPHLRGWRRRLFDLRLFLGSAGSMTLEGVLSEHLQHGDAAPALVVSTAPLRVAAYATELDAVVMLLMPDTLVKAHNLSAGDRLLAVSTYAPMASCEDGYAKDLIPGPGSSGHFGDAAPLIADFLCEDPVRLKTLKDAFPAHIWDHLSSLATQYEEYFGQRARKGTPIAVCFDTE